MEEEIKLITKQELIDQNFMITKKFVVIDSSLFTPEAFEYIQELVTYTGSILFISDTKKIYARGKYFGGDIFEADLLYFTKFTTVNHLGIKTGETDAKHAKSTLEFKGGLHMNLMAKYDEETGKNSIEMDYDLSAAVNKDRFTIDENAKYNLDIVNGQIKMVKYIAPYIKLSSLPMLEYDTGDTEVCIKYEVGGSKPLARMDINTSLGNEYIIREKCTESEIYMLAPNNTDITLIIQFDDGETLGRTEITQTWGYACLYGSAVIDYLPNEQTFNNFNKFITLNNPSKTVLISQNGEEYGWFACPSEFNVIFTDSSTNLQGGWRKDSRFMYYADNKLYQVYRTDHQGLGTIKWIINKK